MLDQLGWTGYDYEGRQKLEGAVNTGLYAGLQKVSVGDPLRDPGVMDAYQKQQIALGWAGHNEQVRHNKESEANDRRRIAIEEKKEERDQNTYDIMYNNKPHKTETLPDGTTVEYYVDGVSGERYTITSTPGDYVKMSPDGWWVQDPKTGKWKKTTAGTPGAISGSHMNRLGPDGKPIQRRVKNSLGYTPDAASKLAKLNQGNVQTNVAKMTDNEVRETFSGCVGYFKGGAGIFWRGDVERISGPGEDPIAKDYNGKITAEQGPEIINIVGEWFGRGNLADEINNSGMSDDDKKMLIERIYANVNVKEDHNVFSPNNYSVTLRGVDDTSGAVSKPSETRASYMAIGKLLQENLPQITQYDDTLPQ